MKLHANAALSLKARERMVVAVVEQRRSIALAAEAAGVSDRTCSKWVSRYRSEGASGLLDRSSAPRRVQTPAPPTGQRAQEPGARTAL
jgi:transposase